MLFEAWIGSLAYTLQIYFDFSGYTDMAIGIALMMNIHFPLNFFSPYKATSIIDFWRCWHITLSNWLRDYLYIPLGGNRHGVPAQLRNLMITMFLGGLWHGAGWTFIIWGCLHGVYLVINHLWRRAGIKLHICVCWAVTFLSVVVGWVFFRADSVQSAIIILKGMAGLHGISIPKNSPDFGFFIQSGIITGAPVEGTFSVMIVAIGPFNSDHHYDGVYSSG
jgi:D-alanyl-lipoteichoic acid acyltransferase DltB (MBOAT superfamily)